MDSVANSSISQDVINQMTGNTPGGFTPEADEIWCRFFSDGFFGYGAHGDFKLFSIWHFLPLILFGVAIFLIWRFRAWFRTWKFEENFRFIWAAIMIFIEMSYFWRLLYVGSADVGQINSLLDKLPLQVCEWTCILSCFMLMKKRDNWLFQICFYVCLTAGTCALIIPNTAIATTGPTYYRYYQFWLEHMLPTLAALYMAFVHGYRPKLKGVFISAGFLGTLGTVCIICNHVFKEHNARYMYFDLFKNVPILGIPWVTPIFFAIVMFIALTAVYFATKLLLMLIYKHRAKKKLKLSK